MNIQINSRLLIGDIQKKFREAFPFLQLVFFRQPWNPMLIRLQPELSSAESLQHFHKETKPREFNITPKDKVAAVEQNFRDQYALEVQVMRRSGNTWLMTKETDNYTLEQQNALGLEMSSAISADEPEDIHEQQ
jgi:hypothetical protein